MEKYYNNKEMQYLNNSTKIEELAYESLMDFVVEECRLPWVTPVFVEGHPCYQSYTDALESKESICDRLHSCDDPECQAMFDALLLHGKILSKEMFRLGIHQSS